MNVPVIEIKDGDVGHEAVDFPEQFEARYAARAVLVDGDGNVAVSHEGKRGILKSPGGGVEEGEDLMAALSREVREEAGCDMEDVRPLLIIKEMRARGYHGGFLQTSTCFVARVKGEKGEPDFDEGERANGFSLRWMAPGEALAAMQVERGADDDYAGPFVRRRERVLLEAGLDVLGLV